MTSALYETLRRLAYHSNGQNSCETVATAVGESSNLFLLVFEATCFENVCPLRVVTRLKGGSKQFPSLRV